MSIGNLSKDVRRRPSDRGMILIGYIPVLNIDFITNKEERREKSWEIYHAAMREILAPLQEAGQRGEEMTCADGRVQRMYPLLAAHMGDFEEQSLFTCTYKTRCPICVVSLDQRGEFVHSRLRTRMQTLKALDQHQRGYSFTRDNLGIRAALPFWAKLPFANGHSSAVPDLLHQLHKGMFKKHLVDRWTHIMGTSTLDQRLMGLPRYSGLRHFKYGISGFEQWTGNKAKTLAKVFLPTVAGMTPQKAVGAARCLIDFMYRAHLPQMNEDDLDALESDSAEFHDLKSIFIERGALTLQHGWSDIPKLHMLIHYAHMIREYGTTDGFNTESSERLHIDYVKLGYRASNKVEPIKQMIIYLQQREAWAMLRQRLEDEGVIARRKRRRQPSDDFDEDDGDGDNRGDPGGGDRGGEGEGKGDQNGDNDQDGEGDDEGAEDDDGEERTILTTSKQRHWSRVGDHHVYYPFPTISTAERPTKTQVPAERIINFHGAADFLSCVKDYVSSLPNAQHHARLINASSLFYVWTSCGLSHKPLPFAPLVGRKIDYVQACPATPTQPLRSARSAAFDTVLLEVDPNAHSPARELYFSSPLLFCTRADT
jgi:hypothetical protein